MSVVQLNNFKQRYFLSNGNIKSIGGATVNNTEFQNYLNTNYLNSNTGYTGAINSNLVLTGTFHTTSTGAGSVNLGEGTVTQLTSVTTAVTCNTPSGIITTFNATGGTGSFQTFTLNNTSITSSSVPIVSIANYAGTTGFPYVSTSTASNGSVPINIANYSNTAALNGALKIAYAIL